MRHGDKFTAKMAWTEADAAHKKAPACGTGLVQDPEIRKMRATVVSASPGELERPPRTRHQLPPTETIRCSAKGTWAGIR